MDAATPPVVIESAKATDVPALATLLVEQMAGQQATVSADRLCQVLDTVIANPERGFALAARAGDPIVGVAYAAIILSAEHAGPVLWLEELFVAPAARSRGIGTALLEGVLTRARNLGVVAVDLEVDEVHRRVASLYRRFGFEPLNRSRFFRKLVST